MSDMVENVGVAIGISSISHSVPEIQFTSGLESAILNYGGQLTSANVGSITSSSGMSKMWGSRRNFVDISFHSRDTMYFRFKVRHHEMRGLLTYDDVGEGWQCHH